MPLLVIMIKGNHPHLKSVLIISHTFPPQIKTGANRIRAFFCDLPNYGWKALILTIGNGHDPLLRSNLHSYHQKDDAVYRIKPLFFRMSHYKLINRLFSLFHYPDPNSFWAIPAILFGRKLLLNKQANVLLSTFPVATSHLVGACLNLLTGVPWCADFRDPMVQEGYPKDPLQRLIWRWIESRTVRHAHKILFTTQAACEYYIRRYPFLDMDRCAVVPNGYIEEDFEHIPTQSKATHSGPIRFIHAGTLYAEERNPKNIFEGIAKLLKSGSFSHEDFVFDFYGSGDAKSFYSFSEMARDLRLARNICFHPPISHSEILALMSQYDVLVLIQGPSCNHQIPAKAYEYFRLRKPILAFTNPNGETGKLIISNNAGIVTNINDSDAIADSIREVITLLRQGQSLPIIDENRLPLFSRTYQAERLAAILDGCLYAFPK